MSNPKIRALIAEDHLPSQRALVGLLRQIGFDVQAVTTIADARAALATYHPEILIANLMLPDGNGSKLLQEVRDNDLPTRVAVVSGVVGTSLDEMTKLRPDAMFGQPVDISELDDWLEEQMRELTGASSTVA